MLQQSKGNVFIDQPNAQEQPETDDLLVGGVHLNLIIQHPDLLLARLGVLYLELDRVSLQRRPSQRRLVVEPLRRNVVSRIIPHDTLEGMSQINPRGDQTRSRWQGDFSGRVPNDAQQSKNEPCPC